MGLFRKRGDQAAEVETTTSRSGEEIVRDFLRAQNLEQVGRTEEAIELYERAVTERFDSSGPYDRLIVLYQKQRRHHDVIRVAEASLQVVRTYPQKRVWYETQLAEATQALGSAIAD